MTTTLERPTVPARHRIDAPAYYRMAEVGILKEEDRVELIDGGIIDMAPIGDEHAFSTSWLAEEIIAVARGLAFTIVQNPIRLDAYNVPQPDLALLRLPHSNYRHRTPEAADVLLLIEVAQTSYDYDSTIKLALYARHGIPEYWIVDLVSRTVEVHREPRDGVYTQHEKCKKGLLTPVLLPGLTIDVGALLG